METHKPKQLSPPEFPKVIETFRTVGSFEVGNLTDREPSCFNGWVRIRKYRITIEEVEEPREVLTARLQKLWEECDNCHHYGPLLAVAASLKYEFPVGSFGTARKKKT